MKRVIDELEFGLVGHYSESVRIRGKWYDRHDVVELYRTLTQPITGAECVILLSKYTAFFNGTRKKRLRQEGNTSRFKNALIFALY